MPAVRDTEMSNSTPSTPKNATPQGNKGNEEDPPRKIRGCEACWGVENLQSKGEQISFNIQQSWGSRRITNKRRQFCPVDFSRTGTSPKHLMKLKRAGLKAGMELNSFGKILQMSIDSRCQLGDFSRSTSKNIFESYGDRSSSERKQKKYSCNIPTINCSGGFRGNGGMCDQVGYGTEQAERY